MMIDDLQGRIPPAMKWGLAGIGAAGGLHFAQVNGSPIPQSCVFAGAAAGFCLLCIGFAGLRILRAVVIFALVLVVANYAVLVPFGYGDHGAAWLSEAQDIAKGTADAAAAFAARWLHGMR